MTVGGGDILQKMRFAAVCTLIATLMLLGAPAHRAAAADPVLTAELTDFRPWLGPTNDLTATMRLTNHGSARLPLSGLQIHVEVFAGPRHRTDLENQFEGHIGQTVWSDTDYLSLPDLAPGESRDVQFDIELGIVLVGPHQGVRKGLGRYRAAQFSNEDDRQAPRSRSIPTSCISPSLRAWLTLSAWPW